MLNKNDDRIKKLEEKNKLLEERVEKLETIINVIKDKIGGVVQGELVAKKRKWLSGYPDEQTK